MQSPGYRCVQLQSKTAEVTCSERRRDVLSRSLFLAILVMHDRDENVQGSNAMDAISETTQNHMTKLTQEPEARPE